MIQRESIEWCEMYWYATEHPELPRVLLVGDSIVVGERERLANILAGQVTVGGFSTSKIVGDPALFRELDFVLSDYPPNLIVFNNGLHQLKCDDDFYRRGLEMTLDYFEERIPVRILWRNTTPVSLVGHPEILDEKLNAVVLRRNAIAEEIMARRGIPVIDLYTPMAAHPEYGKGDSCHYKPEGYLAQAEILKPIILSHLKR